MNLRQRAELFLNFAKILEAGLPISRGLEVLQKSPRSGSEGGWLRHLDAGVQRGVRLEETLSTSPESSQLEAAVLGASERCGRLPAGFRCLGDYYETLHGARSKLLRALGYPLLVVHVAIVSPRVPLWFSEGLSFGSVGSVLWEMSLFWGILVGAWKGGEWVLRRAAKSEALDSAVGLMPLLGRTWRHWAQHRWLFVAQIGMQAGLSVYEILDRCGQVCGSARLKAAGGRVAGFLEGGATLGEAMVQAGGFPSAWGDFIRTGEATGSLPEELSRLGRWEMEAAVAATESAAMRLPKIVFGLAFLWTLRAVLRVLGAAYAPLQSLGSQ